jgi:hypothetical protein
VSVGKSQQMREEMAAHMEHIAAKLEALASQTRSRAEVLRQPPPPDRALPLTHHTRRASHLIADMTALVTDSTTEGLFRHAALADVCRAQELAAEPTLEAAADRLVEYRDKSPRALHLAEARDPQYVHAWAMGVEDAAREIRP